MPYTMSKYPSIKASFNITPILLEQIELYDDIKNDKFLTLWIKDPAELLENEKKYLLKIIRALNIGTKVKSKRLIELFFKDHYSQQEMIDIEVLFLLSWCGEYLKNENKTVQKLIDKKRDYSSKNKESLLRELLAFVKEIVLMYKSLMEKGRICVSTTPYTHPILPLLIDIKNAKKANLKTKIPKIYFSLIDDALIHIKKAKEIYKRFFGIYPKGFWPAEGGIDKKSIELYKNEGIKWIASDEAVLLKSKNCGRKEIYKIYEFNDTAIVFRDTKLSDLIGFKYRYLDEVKAADDFMKRIESFEEVENVFVILDGDIGVIGNGAGLTMATCDAIYQMGGKPANFLDIGGGAGPERVAYALDVIRRLGNVKVILINIFGGITRADNVAKGIIAALENVEKVGKEIPLVVRLTGTNEEIGRKMLEEVGIKAYTNMDEAVKKAIEIAKSGGE